jgi:hypothetical protein
MPVVLVEIAPPDAPAALARALVEACSAAVREGKCGMAVDEPAGTPVVVAIVRWNDDDERRVRIEVGVRQGREPDWRTRTLEFAQKDTRTERWRSVGLTVATLAGEMVPATATAPSAGTTGTTGTTGTGGTAGTVGTAGPGLATGAAGETSGPTPTSRPALPPKEQSEAEADRQIPDASPRSIRPRVGGAALWIGASAVAGPGLDGGGWRWGGRAEAGWRPAAAPVFARLAASYSVRPADDRGVSVQWQTVGIGAGLIVGAGAVTLEPWVAGGLEALRVAVDDPASGLTDSGGLIGVSAQGGADVVWRLGPVSLSTGMDVGTAHTSARILVHDRQVSSVPATRWLGSLGVRFFLD